MYTPAQFAILRLGAWRASRVGDQGVHPGVPPQSNNMNMMTVMTPADPLVGLRARRPGRSTTSFQLPAASRSLQGLFLCALLLAQGCEAGVDAALGRAEAVTIADLNANVDHLTSKVEDLTVGGSYPVDEDCTAVQQFLCLGCETGNAIGMVVRMSRVRLMRCTEVEMVGARTPYHAIQLCTAAARQDNVHTHYWQYSSTIGCRGTHTLSIH